MVVLPIHRTQCCTLAAQIGAANLRMSAPSDGEPLRFSPLKVSLDFTEVSSRRFQAWCITFAWRGDPWSHSRI
jgi:hypothetical protein